MSLPKRNSADGRCYWMKPEVQEELQPLFDQCIQDAIDGRITRLDSLWPPVVVSSEGAPFEVWQLLRTWTEAQRAETLDAEKAIAFSENLRRQSRWGEIDHHLLDMLKRELQEKYFVVTGNEDDHFWDREYSLKPGIRAEEVPEPLLRFACYVAVSYKVYGMDFQYLDTNYLFGLVEKVRPDMVKKLRENGTGRLPISLQKRKTEHFTASANDAFAVIRITARDNTEECCHEVLNYLCEILEQEDFPRSYAVEFKGPEKSYLPMNLFRRFRSGWRNTRSRRGWPRRSQKSRWMAAARFIPSSVRSGMARMEPLILIPLLRRNCASSPISNILPSCPPSRNRCCRFWNGAVSR